MNVRKWIYYALPFVVFPVYQLLFEWILGMRNWSFTGLGFLICSFCGGLLLLSVGISLFSRSRQTFDLLITVLTPLAFFCTVFLVCFIGGGISYEPFDLPHAICDAAQPTHLILYALMALLAFGASFRKFRLLLQNKTSG